MKTIPYWKKIKLPKYPRLTRDQKFDVTVIGGGITGLTAAYLLKKAGKKVCLLERDRIGAVDTGNTTAHLTYVTDLRISEIAKTFGKESARLTWLGGSAAINTIEQIARELRADCGFRRVPGFLHASLDSPSDERKNLRKDADLARELGFDAAYLEAVPYMNRPGVRFSNQAKFHPLAYLASVAEAVVGDGSMIFEGANVSEVKSDPLAVVVNDSREIECDYVVIATHVPVMGQASLTSATLFQTKIYPYTSYVVGAKIPKGTVPEAEFWDTSDPYYYLRIDQHSTYDYAIFGGQDHKTGQEQDPEGPYGRLTAKLLELIPQAKIDHRWSGQVIETNDGLPFMGETADRQFASTGYSGNGMTFGTLGAMMACDAVLGRENPWQSLFSVNRKKVRGGTWDYLKENFDYPYHLLRDRLTPSEGSSTRDVKRGEGKILKLDGQRVACSRDDDGKLTTVSAVCTHMGCLVHWNRSEKTWDCPCHGSRFHPSGEVLAGPAESPLEPVKTKPSPSSTRSQANDETKKPARPRSAGAGKGR